jgi:hypothetical protein
LSQTCLVGRLDRRRSGPLDRHRQILRQRTPRDQPLLRRRLRPRHHRPPGLLHLVFRLFRRHQRSALHAGDGELPRALRLSLTSPFLVLHRPLSHFRDHADRGNPRLRFPGESGHDGAQRHARLPQRLRQLPTRDRRLGRDPDAAHVLRGARLQGLEGQHPRFLLQTGVGTSTEVQPAGGAPELVHPLHERVSRCDEGVREGARGHHRICRGRRGVPDGEWRTVENPKCDDLFLQILGMIFSCVLFKMLE